MKKWNKWLAAGLCAGMLFATSATAMAAESSSPAKIVAELTEKSLEDVINDHFETGKTYGEMADAAGKLEEFQDAILDLKQGSLAQQVKDKVITQDRADEILKLMEENQAICDGTGSGICLNSTGNGHCLYGDGSCVAATTSQTGTTSYTGRHHSEGYNGTGHHGGGYGQGRGHGRHH